MKNLQNLAFSFFRGTSSSKLLFTWIIAALLISNLNVMAQDSNEGKVLLAVFAHPDDEFTVAPILAKYVSEGVKVHLVITTDGRYGVNDFTDHEAGEGLVAMRKLEMQCAAEKLGVELIHLNYHDQLRAREGYDGHMPHVKALVKELYGIVENIQTDVIITWGPDGGSTHLDHRLTGASITQVFVSKVWDKPTSLYFYGTPSDHIDDPDSKILRGQDKRYLTTRVTFTQEHWDKALNSLACHKTQVSPEGLQRRKDRVDKTGMTIYLRKFTGPTEISDTVFD